MVKLHHSDCWSGSVLRAEADIKHCASDFAVWLIHVLPVIISCFPTTMYILHYIIIMYTFLAVVSLYRRKNNLAHNSCVKFV